MYISTFLKISTKYNGSKLKSHNDCCKGILMILRGAYSKQICKRVPMISACGNQHQFRKSSSIWYRYESKLLHNRESMVWILSKIFYSRESSVGILPQSFCIIGILQQGLYNPDCTAGIIQGRFCSKDSSEGILLQGVYSRKSTIHSIVEILPLLKQRSEYTSRVSCFLCVINCLLNMKKFTS